MTQTEILSRQHGGQAQKIGNKWWWIGENRKGNRNICLYSSDDLFNWKNEGYAMRTVDTAANWIMIVILLHCMEI